jgi:hypothetical protein
LPPAQKKVGGWIKSGEQISVQVPRQAGINIKLSPEGAKDDHVILHHAGSLTNPVRIAVGTKSSIWPMAFGFDDDRRTHFLEAYQLISRHQKSKDSLQRPLVWVAEWEEELSSWNLTLNLDPAVIRSEIMKMDQLPSGEQKDREFNARSVHLFLQTSKKYQFHNLGGQVFDRELVINADWRSAELSLVIPTHFPAQYGHNGGEVTHLRERYWEIPHI